MQGQGRGMAGAVQRQRVQGSSAGTPSPPSTLSPARRRPRCCQPARRRPPPLHRPPRARPPPAQQRQTAGCGRLGCKRQEPGTPPASSQPTGPPHDAYCSAGASRPPTPPPAAGRARAAGARGRRPSERRAGGQPARGTGSSGQRRSRRRALGGRGRGGRGGRRLLCRRLSNTPTRTPAASSPEGQLRSPVLTAAGEASAAHLGVPSARHSGSPPPGQHLATKSGRGRPSTALSQLLSPPVVSTAASSPSAAWCSSRRVARPAVWAASSTASGGPSASRGTTHPGTVSGRGGYE